MAITIQMVIGRLVLEKIVGNPEKYPQEVVGAAEIAIEYLSDWDGRYASMPENWHKPEGSSSWGAFKSVAEEHNLTLSEILSQ